MVQYILKRLGSGLLSLLILITVIFFASQILIPGDFVTQFALSFAPGTQSEGMEQLREEMGLDRPLTTQFAVYLGSLFTGNLGNSYYGYPVTDVLGRLIPPTLLVFILGTLTAFMIGGWLGKATAWRAPAWFSKTSVVIAVSFYTSFPPWLAFLVYYIIAGPNSFLGMGMYRSSLGDPYGKIFRNLPVDAQTVMLIIFFTVIGLGLFFYFVRWAFKALRQIRISDLWIIPFILIGCIPIWYWSGIWDGIIEILRAAAPAFIAYVLLTFGETMLIMRTSMRDYYGEDFVLLARAKGLTRSQVSNDHVARNAILPVLSNLLLGLPYALTGMVIIEKSTGWYGIGQTLFASMQNQDMPVVIGALILIGVFSLVLRILLDILQAVLDPRIRTMIETSGEAE